MSLARTAGTCLFVLLPCPCPALRFPLTHPTGDKKTTQIVQILRADEDTVNVAVGHPYEPLLAVSGIDYTIKLFSPDQRLQSEFSEFGAVPADENRPCSAAAAAAAATAAATGGDEPMREASEEQERWTYSGRASRRRLHSKDEITSQNSVMNESGASRHVITVRGFAVGFGDWLQLFV